MMGTFDYQLVQAERNLLKNLPSEVETHSFVF